MSPWLDPRRRIAAGRKRTNREDRDLRGSGQHVRTGSMPHRYGLRTILGFGSISFATLATLGAGTGCEKDQLTGPAAEVTKSKEKPNLPAVPSFELPPANPDGSHSAKELRVKGSKLLETDITVKGVVTWAYDCPTAIRTPGEADDAVQKRINEDPTLCERAKFYVGDAADTAPMKSIWVVDVPRPYNKLEMERIKKKDRTLEMYPDRCEPNEKDAAKAICPPYAVGDQVEVTGTWKLASPHSERNSDGLLVFKRMKNVTKNWESPAHDPTAPAGPPGAAGSGAPAGGAAPAGGPARPSPQDIVDQAKKKG